MLITLLLMSGLALASSNQGNVKCKPLFTRVRIDFASGNMGNNEATARLGKKQSKLQSELQMTTLARLLRNCANNRVKHWLGAVSDQRTDSLVW